MTSIAAAAQAQVDALAASATELFGELASRLDFASLLDQQGRLMQLSTALPVLALVPERMVMREAVNEPFELVLDALSTSRYFELKTLIGQQMTLSLLGSDGAYHPWHGYVFQAAQLGTDGGLARYRLHMRPWLSLLGLRRDSRVWQDQTALQIAEAVFKRYPQAQYALQVTETLRCRSLCVQYRETDLDFVRRLLAEEGLSWHFVHLDGEAARSADASGQARHQLVITDRNAVRVDLGEARFTTQHETAVLEGQRDAITAFAACRRVAPNATARGAWDYRQLAGTSASDATALDIGELPLLEHYDGAGAYRHESADHAQRAATLALQAHEQAFKTFEGRGSARHFTAGSSFQLTDHPLYGSATASRPDNSFTLTAVEHHAANNLGAGVAELLRHTDVERGSYRNQFHAVPAATVLVPPHRPKPTAPGMQTALVVGVEGEALTTDRDLRVKIQYPWQRGERPLAGGLSEDDENADAGNAPADETAGTWVRVAQPSAGANWGTAFVPRIGTEVAVEYIEADIDRPVITGQLHNGQDLPPFSAGEDSAANHPGVLSGVHSSHLDGSGYNQWVVDDATGQLRMRLATSTTAAQLGLGHLITQSGAWRGAWRGAGFETHTQGWTTVRAGQGLLISTSARPGSHGSAQGTQMDAAEALAQIHTARDLGQRLSQAAQASRAHPLTSHDDGQALHHLAQAIDPQQDGHHPGPVNSHSPFQPGPDGRSEGTDPVDTFARPHIVLDTPSTQAWTSEASLMSLAGQDTSLVAQADVQHSAAHTYAQVSGKTSSLYTHEGGAKLIAANGPVSLRAHTDQLQIWADQEVSVQSVNDEIRILAHSQIEIIGGQSSLLLKDSDITFTCPGNFSVKGATHQFLGGGSQAASLAPLPDAAIGEMPREVELHFHYDDLSPVVGAPYKVSFEDGTVLQGSLDGNGYALLSGVPAGTYTVEYGEDSRNWQPPPLPEDDAPFAQADVQDQGAQAIEKMLQTQAPIGDTSENLQEQAA